MHPSSGLKGRRQDNLTLEPDSENAMSWDAAAEDSPVGCGSNRGWDAAFKTSRLLAMVAPRGVENDFEEVRKRKLFATLIVPGVIILLTFGSSHLLNGNLVEGCLDLSGGLWLICSLVCLRLMKRGLAVYRINTTFLGLLFLYMAAKGGIEGNKLLWMFSFPLIAFYNLGIVEGLIWTAMLFGLTLGILFYPLDTRWIHAYSLEFRVRFCVAFVLVSSMSFIYESVRRQSQSNLENESRELQAEKRKLAAMTRTVQAANRALVESERRLKQAQSIARVGNFEYDRASDRLWGSEEALRIFGLAPRRGIFGLDDLKARAPDFHALLSGRDTSGDGTCRFRLMPGDGLSGGADQEAMVYAKMEWLPPSEGQPEKIIGVIQDITAMYQAEIEKQELEARLVRSQKMEALGLLAGGVAHDLNNVLSGIVSYPDLLLVGLPAQSDLKKPLKVIRDSGQKAAAIVQDMLTLARRGVTSFEILNLNELVTEYLQSPELEQLKSYHPGVEIRVNTHKDLFNIKGSAIHLKKSLMNLVSNGAEALQDGGLLQISTQNRYIDRRLEGYFDIAEGEYVVLSVKDNGGGISRDDLGRIFEPFYTKKKMGRSGTGLGLAVVWGTVEDHHGYINVVSEVGKGTLFELYLPATREYVDHRECPVCIDQYRGHGERILVVDDIETQREITSRMLTELGYRVQTAASGEEAVAIIGDCAVDLVILDMIMEPGIDGLETFSRMQSLCPGQKALVVSGFSETKRVKKAQELGAGAYVKKPYAIETLGMAVRRELARETPNGECASRNH